MIWSLNETKRLRIARRIVGGFSTLFGSIRVGTHAGAYFFHWFTPPSLLDLAMAICLVISGFGLLLWQPLTNDGRMKVRKHRGLTFTCVVLLVVAVAFGGLRLAGREIAKGTLGAVPGQPTTPEELNAWYPAVPDNENAALINSEFLPYVLGPQPCCYTPSIES